MGSDRYFRGAGLVMIAGIAAVLGSPAVALASCIAPPPLPRAIREAPAAFVGEVVDLSGAGRWATVEVREVWSGGELPEVVEVRAGPRQESAVTSVDRHFRLSRAYLFIPYERDGSVFKDNACTSTTRFRPELARFRPDSAREPSPTPPPAAPSRDVDEGTGVQLWLVVGVVVAGAAAIALVLARRR